eukprot:3439471-Amphidinium_carterae.1
MIGRVSDGEDINTTLYGLGNVPPWRVECNPSVSSWNWWKYQNIDARAFGTYFCTHAKGTHARHYPQRIEGRMTLVGKCLYSPTFLPNNTLHTTQVQVST